MSWHVHGVSESSGSLSESVSSSVVRRGDDPPSSVVFVVFVCTLAGERALSRTASSSTSRDLRPLDSLLRPEPFLSEDILGVFEEGPVPLRLFARLSLPSLSFPLRVLLRLEADRVHSNVTSISESITPCPAARPTAGSVTPVGGPFSHFLTTQMYRVGRSRAPSGPDTPPCIVGCMPSTVCCCCCACPPGAGEVGASENDGLCACAVAAINSDERLLGALGVVLCDASRSSEGSGDRCEGEWRYGELGCGEPFASPFLLNTFPNNRRAPLFSGCGVCCGVEGAD